MATHNSVRLVGYLLEDPTIANEGQKGAEKVFIKLRTIRRDADDVDPQRFEDIYVFYDGTELIEKVKKLVRFDIIDIKGVFNIVATNKPSRCPDCGAINFRMNGTYSFVYPQWIKKIDNILNSFEYNADLPDSILFQQYKEVSNYLTLIGTVVSKPELLNQDTYPLKPSRILRLITHGFIHVGSRLLMMRVTWNWNRSYWWMDIYIPEMYMSLQNAKHVVQAIHILML